MSTLLNIHALDFYCVKVKTLNTKDFGVPHNRPRVYFVGRRVDRLRRPFSFPEIMPPVTLQSILEARECTPTFDDMPNAKQTTARAHFIDIVCNKLKNDDPFN